MFDIETELWYTEGPASLNLTANLLLAGATGLRLTFSYSTPAYQHKRASIAKAIADEIGKPCFIVADLAGEKYRLGQFEGEPSVPIREGNTIRLRPALRGIPRADNLVFPVPETTFHKLLSQITIDSIVTVGDGGAVVEISSISDDEICAIASSDGTIDQSRGLTVQGNSFKPQSITPKDITDLEHILNSSAYDAIALSFVSSTSEVEYVKHLVSRSEHKIPVIAKIETIAGLDNVKEICECADAVMAARGDLALTMPWTDLPEAVQQISDEANLTSTPWLLATQIVEGVERFSIPTRAEICDLAHWLTRECSGVMLSYETAFGQKPIAAVSCTASIIARWQRSEILT